MATRPTASRARCRLLALPGSTVVPDAAKEDDVTRARRNLDAARLAGKTADKRDIALVARANLAELNRKEAARKQATADAEAKAARARIARRRAYPHDVLPPFKCSPVAHCPRQATLAQCPEFVLAMDRYYLYNRPACK